MIYKYKKIKSDVNIENLQINDEKESVLKSLFSKELKGALRLCIGKLSDIEKELTFLRIIDKVKYTEIAIITHEKKLDKAWAYCTKSLTNTEKAQLFSFCNKIEDAADDKIKSVQNKVSDRARHLVTRALKKLKTCLQSKGFTDLE